MGRAFRFPSISENTSIIETETYRQTWNEDGISETPCSTACDDGPGELGIRSMIALTCSAGGLQVVWSLIMSNGTPFLITVGLPESMTAIVWVVAPLSGVLIQPYVGVLSDQCQSSWGRRRPFILGGTIGCIVSMLALASTKIVVQSIAALAQTDIDGSFVRGAVLTLAILWLVGLNISIQPLQAGIRSLIVDSCPVHQQTLASAWASRLTGMGNILGYLFGFLPIRELIPFLDITQFSWLCLVASSILAGTVFITCYFIKEQDPRSLPVAATDGTSFLATARHILWSAKTMPPAVRQVCVVQFFAWMGWFPYLFYISSYVGDLYAASLLARDISSSDEARIVEDAVRLGSLASLIFSIFALLTNILIPSLITPSSRVDSLSHPLRRIRMSKAWSLSQLLFSFILLTTIFPQTQATATLLAAFIGISWAFTLWIPYAIIGQEIAAHKERSTKVLEGTLELEPTRQDQAGAIMGLHNVAISAPQIIAALGCGAIFWICGKLGVQDSIGWVLRFGAIGGLIAGFLASRMNT